MAEIVRVLRESMPEVKFIGKKYGQDDVTSQGGFAHKWGEWFQNGYFEELRGSGKGLEKISDDYIGLMKMSATGMEYWIGIFMAPEDDVPEGFGSVNLPASEIAVAYAYGSDKDGDIYTEETFMKGVTAWQNEGFAISPDAWCFERYNDPRFTVPDEQGKVILDLCIYL